MQENIVIRGARTNNLKNIDVTIPRNTLTVMTGLSGSGKSSLAFDTIFAEGQRRYVESLSSYARQFLGQMDKPDVDFIEGLSPAVSIDQKTTSHNPRSTVGTVTEIYDYLRVLWARVGIPHCPNCGREIRRQTVDEIVDRILLLPEGTRIQILAPIVRSRKGEFEKIFEDARRSGYVRVRVDGIIYDLSEKIPLDRNRKHNVEIVVDRLVLKPSISRRLEDSVETAVSLAKNLVLINNVKTDEDMLFSLNFACPDCGISIEEITPRTFSFNNPYGACPTCSGLGKQMQFVPESILADATKSLRQGGIEAPGWRASPGSVAEMYYDALARRYGFDLDTPVGELPEEALQKIFYGTGNEKLDLRVMGRKSMHTLQKPFEGILPSMMRRYRESTAATAEETYKDYMTWAPCPDCGGERLKKEARAVTVGGMSLPAFTALDIDHALSFMEELKLEGNAALIARELVIEIKKRLQFMQSVGLGYLTLARDAASLSGGESQRIRLATQIGSGLMGVLYVLDEPSIGLHQRDNEKLIRTLQSLRDMGNTLLVVEHDERMIRAADYIVDIGPGAGRHGGNVVAAGTLDEICACPESITGQYLSGRREIPVPAQRRPGNGHFLTVRGAAENNLQQIDVSFPLGMFLCVTGVSGSGKSSLVMDVLYKALARQLQHSRTRPGAYRSLEGTEYLDKVVQIDQSPIGRTPRSNPATYTGVFTHIRNLFASCSEAKVRGYGPGRFSFNIKGGRCEACSGDGLVKIEMNFLPDVYVPCEVCGGARYNRETLDVRFKGRNIAEVLDMTVEEALDFFRNQQKIASILQVLSDVGLGYVKLGQSSTTLSGGEAQRVKLATELSRPATGSTLYILDEPTTGLHTADIQRLIDILNRLTDAGNTVLVIEHNMDIIKSADYIVDLGPEGGAGGGRVVFQGSPEALCECRESYTGQYLRPVLYREAPGQGGSADG
jgi:excinuclease ABC subunit A